jgi:hypothetical protein
MSKEKMQEWISEVEKLNRCSGPVFLERHSKQFKYTLSTRQVVSWLILAISCIV